MLPHVVESHENFVYSKKKFRKNPILLLISIPDRLFYPAFLLCYIDYPNGRLYWSDLKARVIDSIGLDGKLRKVIHKFHPKEGKPHRLDIFENFIYFSTFQHNKIYKLNKFGRGNMTEIAEDFTRVSDLVIMQENKFKVYKNHSGLINPCENNGPCDQHMPNSLCVLQVRDVTIKFS